MPYRRTRRPYHSYEAPPQYAWWQYLLFGALLGLGLVFGLFVLLVLLP